MLAGRYAPRWPVRRLTVPPSWPERHAIVVGAGLSGAAVASRLAVRGWRIDLVEGGSAPSSAASALRAGVFQPHVSRDDNLLSRFTRAGFLYALRAWAGALDAAAMPPWQRCGVLQLADGAENEARVADTAVALAHPVDYALHATRADATALAGCRAAIGGWWFPMAGFVRPAAIVEAQLGHAARSAGARPAPVLHLDRNVASLQRAGDRWAARDASGAKIAAAPVVILANACDAARLVDLGCDPLRWIRGQQSYLRAPPFAAPRVVVGGDGYVLPAVDGIAVAGATYDLEDDDPCPNDVSHAVNLARAEHMLPGSAAGIDAGTLDGGVGFRCVATDRLPMVGAIVDIDRARADQAALAGAHLADLPRVGGLYGGFAFASSGLSWSALAREAPARELEAEPAPLSHALPDAIDPAASSSRRCARRCFSASLEAINTSQHRNASCPPDSHSAQAEYARHRRPPGAATAAGLSDQMVGPFIFRSFRRCNSRRDEGIDRAAASAYRSGHRHLPFEGGQVHRDSSGQRAGNRSGRRQLDDRRTRHRALGAHGA
jgi:tRNA 5-methylaminomethyl-2-thiouridine biosynthesis bifunctional protein